MSEERVLTYDGAVASDGDALRGRLGDDVSHGTLGRPDAGGSGLRRRRWKTSLIALVAPVLSLVIAVSFFAGCVDSSLAGSDASSIVPRDERERVARADVDTEGLSVLARAIGEMEEAPSGDVNWVWADRLQYWDQSNYNLRTRSWPVPNGADHHDRYCFNSTLANAYVLATGDWSMTVDRGIEECRQTYHHAHPGEPGRPVTWPWHQYDMWHERVNLHSRMLAYDLSTQREDASHADGEWNKEHCERVSDDETYRRVKEALMEGHPCTGGCQPGQDTLMADGTLNHPTNGHSFLWYKYDPVGHVFYAKDSFIGGGPSVAYPEHGGAVSPYELIVGGDGPTCYWMDEEDRRELECPPSKDAIRALERAELEMPDAEFVGCSYPLYKREIWGASYEDSLDTDLSFALDSESEGTDWESFCLSHGSCGGDGTRWVSEVIEDAGGGPPVDGTAFEWYLRAMAGEFGNVGDVTGDPAMSGLAEGMVACVPVLPSDDVGSRMSGQVAMCVGDGVVAYDDGHGVVLADASDYVTSVSTVAPVLWWEPTAMMSAEPVDVHGEDAVSLSLPSPSGASCDVVSIAGAVEGALTADGHDTDDVRGTRLVGQCDVAGTSTYGYVLTLSDGTERGYDVFVDDAGVRSVAADWVVADAQTLYWVSEGEYVPVGSVSAYGAVMGEVLGLDGGGENGTS